MIEQRMIRTDNRPTGAGARQYWQCCPAIALGHDCGHGPGGHASEEAFDAFIPKGFDLDRSRFGGHW